MNACSPIQDRLADAGIDALRGDAALAAHLSSCDDCMAVLTGLAELDRWLDEEPEVPPGLVDATLAFVEQEAGPRSTSPPPPDKNEASRS
jgi:hypothetical protein